MYIFLLVTFGGVLLARGGGGEDGVQTPRKARMREGSGKRAMKREKWDGEIGGRK